MRKLGIKLMALFVLAVGLNIAPAHAAPAPQAAPSTVQATIFTPTMKPWICTLIPRFPGCPTPRG